MKEIDARNLSCPAPVLAAKEAIESEHPAAIAILVDNDAAKQNVSRFLTSRSYRVEVEKQGNAIKVTGTREAGPLPGGSVAPAIESHHAAKIMVMIATDRLGFGDDELGSKLMISFIKTLKEMGADLWRLVFVNNGVKLTIAGSAVLDDLKVLAANHVHILVCGTCLTHFGLLEAKQVGETTNMLDIVTAMQLADKVINI
jgi:selenium metabolism protein YedF